MNNLLLDNYNLSKFEILQSLLVSEYGLRHWTKSTKKTECAWGHRIIAVIELCPLIGLIATIIERLAVSCIRSNNNKIPSNKTEQPHSPTISSQTSSIKNRKWFFKGNQARCNGPVAIDKVKSICVKLNTNPPTGIQFNQEKVGDSVEGGTCTAMSLEFLDSYLKAKKLSVQTSDNRSAMFIDKIVELGQKFSSSSEEMRNRQAAYNTIEVQLDKSLVNKADYSKNKMQAIANYHSLTIDHASPEIDTKELNDKSELAKEVDALPEGAFLVRIIKPANNEKLEEHGHSVVYIKENGLGIFYDPNYGARNVSPSKHSEILFEGFKSYFQSFEINKARFYRLKST